MTPDAFLSDLFDQLAQLVTNSLANARQNLNKSGVSAPEFIGILEGQKLLQLERDTFPTWTVTTDLVPRTLSE